jgi:hypothetical protein
MNDTEKELNRLRHFFKGNEAAVELCQCLAYIVHLWDDLIDKDKERTDEDINAAFWMLFSTIPRNEFYRQEQDTLLPLLERMILTWHDANKLEKGTRHDCHLAYGLRMQLLQIFHHIAFLVGGYAWIREIGPEIQRLNDYDLMEFMKEKEDENKWDV